MENSSKSNHTGDVMISVLLSSTVNCGFESRSGQTKDKKNIFSPLSMQYKEVRGQTDWNQDYVSVR